MKKFLLFMFMLYFANCAFALSDVEILGKIENSLFGFEYVNENSETRVARIEENVYGMASNINLKERIARLKKDLGAELYGQEIEPCEDTIARDEENREVLSNAEANIDYPVINELEKSVFQKEYKNLGVKDRLSQLEKEVFKTNYSNEDLSTRVDRLRDKVHPQTLDRIAGNDDFNISGYYPPSMPYDGMEIGGNQSYFDHDYDYQPLFRRKNNLNSIENSLYHKNFKNDDMSNRLSRVEMSMFGQTFEHEDEKTRANRISSAYNAQKSSGKYDSNKFTQNMATAMQIGTMILMILACIL